MLSYFTINLHMVFVSFTTRYRPTPIYFCFIIGNTRPLYHVAWKIIYCNCSYRNGRWNIDTAISEKCLSRWKHCWIIKIGKQELSDAISYSPTEARTGYGSPRLTVAVEAYVMSSHTLKRILHVRLVWVGSILTTVLHMIAMRSILVQLLLFYLLDNHVV